MGVSDECDEKRIHDPSKKTIILNPDLSSLQITTIDDIAITEEDGSAKMAELDTENSIPFLLYTQNPIKKKPNNILYWKLPSKFLGNKLTAYGGQLSYRIIFEYLKPDEQLSYSPDLVLVGSNQEEVHYSHPEKLKSKTLTKLSIDLIEDSFTDAKGEPIRKDQLMNVLFDLNRILIKASYTKDIVFTGIKEIKLVNSDQIESCVCPTGYTGDSCDRCAQGYFKKPGSYYHQCIPCDCNGNSQKCDPFTGHCLECEYNFEGDRCEKCKTGHLLSRTRNLVECIPLNFTHVDYEENKICSDSTEGDRCERCRAGYYNLVNGHCTKCSCSGVTNKCREGFGYLDEITIKNDSLQLKDKESNRPFLASKSGDQKFTFSNLPKDRTSIFWQLPAEFLGNKIKSYGYNLTYKADITPIETEDSVVAIEPDVQIKSKTTTIIYMSGETKTDRVFNVLLKENLWERQDKVNKQFDKLSKLEFLNVLSDIQGILIRAVYHDKQQTTSISNIKLTTVTDKPSSVAQKKVQTNIEQCFCPMGYTGTSCENCKHGFTRNSEGLCVKCSCNGHSNECELVKSSNDNTQHQQCLRCLHNTIGPSCNLCKKGRSISRSKKVVSFFGIAFNSY